MDPQELTDATFDAWEADLAQEQEENWEATLKTFEQRVQRVAGWIKSHLHEEHDPESLARRAHFSPYHFQRIFHSIKGETLAGYIRRLRMDEAAKALRESDKQIVRIAMKAGYESHESFSRAFKSHFGVTPSEYRVGGGPAHWCDKPTRVRFGRGGSILKADDSEVDPMIEVALKDVPAKHIASPGNRGACDDDWLWLPRLLKLVWKSGGLERDRLSFLMIDHQNTRAWQADEHSVEPCVIVDVGTAANGDVTVKVLPAGRYAVVSCDAQVSRERIYDWLYGHWLPTNGLEPADSPAYIEMPIDLPHAAEALGKLAATCGEDVENAAEVFVRVVKDAKFYLPVREI